MVPGVEHMNMNKSISIQTLEREGSGGRRTKQQTITWELRGEHF